MIIKKLNQIKEWDKKWAKKIQDKFNLTDYQMLCLAFAKGFVIGAILLQLTKLVNSARVHIPVGSFKWQSKKNPIGERR